MSAYEQMYVVSKDEYQKLKEDKSDKEEKINEKSDPSDSISDISKSQINNIEVTKGGTVVIDAHTGLNSSVDEDAAKNKINHQKERLEGSEFIPFEEFLFEKGRKKLGKKTEKALQSYYGGLGIDDSNWKEHYYGRGKIKKDDGVIDPPELPFKDAVQAAKERIKRLKTEEKLRGKLGSQAVKEQIQKVKQQSKLQALLDAQVEKNGTFFPDIKKKKERVEAMDVDTAKDAALENVSKTQEAMDIDEMRSFIKERTSELKGVRKKRTLDIDTKDEKELKFIKKASSSAEKKKNPPPPKISLASSASPPSIPQRKRVLASSEKETYEEPPSRVQNTRGEKRKEILGEPQSVAQVTRAEKRKRRAQDREFEPPFAKSKPARAEKRKGRSEDQEFEPPFAKSKPDRGVKRELEIAEDEFSKRFRPNAPFAGRKRSAPVNEWDPPEGFVKSQPTHPPKVNAEGEEYPLWI